MAKKFRAQGAEYQVMEFLGEGLSGEVYLALRVDSLRRSRQKVVLKILKDQKQLSWAQREFSVLKAVNSPYCRRILAWENFSGRAALVLEHIDGLTLEELGKLRGFEDFEIKEILCQAQFGLAALREAGLCHGDLNLRNILLDRDGRVRLIDFAQSEGEEAVDYGTPAYLAPERWIGGPPSIEADLFSLALIVYDLECGNWNAGLDCRAARDRATHFCAENTLGLADPSSRRPLALDSCDQARSSLAVKVSEILSKREAAKVNTCRLPDQRTPSMGGRSHFLALMGAVILMGWPQGLSALAANFLTHGSIQVRSARALRVSVDGKFAGFTPIRELRLLEGEHRLTSCLGQICRSQSILVRGHARAFIVLDHAPLR